MPTFPEFANTYAEYVIARSRTIATVPDGVATIEAGAVPLAGLTAWQALVDTMGLGRGDRLLIHAASGGVGHLAVQIAKARGAEVWGTASARNHEQLLALGVDHLIDYRTQQFEEVATEMDGVLDLVGDGDTAARSLACLRKGGKLVSISPMIPSAEALEQADVSGAFVLVEPDYASLESLARLMAAGALRVVIGEQRPLADMEELHNIGQNGSPLGKLVATVAADG
jgi:NADPH:quinone reductase-like Zn-dependent oxidoreductase